MENELSRSPRYKHTRELVRIALQEGMTQVEIARVCRTTQSVVSEWANGKKKAAENVIKPLLDRYGHRLRRASFRLYLVQLQPEVPWEQTETGKLALRLSEDPTGFVRERLSKEEWEALVMPYVRRKRKPTEGVAGAETVAPPGRRTGGWRQPSPTPPLPVDLNIPTEEDLLPITAADIQEAEQRLNLGTHPAMAAAWIGLGLEAAPVYSGAYGVEAMKADYLRPYQRLVRVEGAPLWRHVMAVPVPTTSYLGKTEVKGIAMQPRKRLLVHPATESGQFWLVCQSRRHLTGSELHTWERQKAAIERGGSSGDEGEIRSEDDVARWIGTVVGPLSLGDLLDAVQKRLVDAGPHDRAVVPFTLRKALVEHGHVLDDVLSPYQANPSNNTIPKIVP